MTYMKSNKSDVLNEFGRILQEKDALKKTAQVQETTIPWTAPSPSAPEAPLTTPPGRGNVMPGAEQMLSGPKPAHWEKIFAALEAARGNPKALEKVQAEIQTMNYPTHEQGYYDQALQLLQKYMASVQTDAKAKQHPHMVDASANVEVKTADQKAYDVTPDSKIVHEAHPKSAVVSGDVVESLEEQQKADLEVARKSAEEVLQALYKLAKKLQKEGNEQAYKLVKATFMDIASTLKKGA